MIYWIRKELYFRRMERHVKLGQYDAAHDLLDQLLKHRPQDRDVVIQKAWVHLEQQDYTQVLDCLAPHEPLQDPVMLMLQGECFYHLGQFDAAKTHLLKAAEISPDNLRTEYALGLTYIALGDFSQAARWFENTVKYDPHLLHSRLLVCAEHYLHHKKFANLPL